MSSLLLDIASPGQIISSHGGLFHIIFLCLAFARTAVAQDEGESEITSGTNEDSSATSTSPNAEASSGDFDTPDNGAAVFQPTTTVTTTVTNTVTVTAEPKVAANKGALSVAIALGVLLIIVLIAIGIFFYIQRRRKIMAKRRRKYQVGSPFNFQESAWGYPGAEAWFKSQGAMLTPHQRTMIMSSPFMTNNYAGQMGQIGQVTQIGQMVQAGPHHDHQGNRVSMYPSHYDPAKMLIQGPSTTVPSAGVGYPKPAYSPAQYQPARPRPETSPPMLGVKFPQQLLNPTIQGRASAHGAIELEGSGGMPPMPRTFSPPLMSPCQYHSADDVCAPPAPPPKSPMYLRPSQPVRRLSGLGINTNIKERGASEKSAMEYPTDVSTLVPEVTITRSSVSMEAPNTSQSCPSYLPSYTSQEQTSSDAAFPPAEYLAPSASATALPTAGSSQDISTSNPSDEGAIPSQSRETFGLPKRKRKPPRLANFAEIVIPPGQSPPLSPVIFRLDASPTDAPLESPDTIPSPHSAKSQSSVRSWFKFGKGKSTKNHNYHLNKFSFQSQASDTTYIDNSVGMSDSEKGKMDPYDTDVSENFPYGDERYYRTALKTAPLNKTQDMSPSESSTHRSKPKKKRSLREQIVSLPTSVATMYVKDGKVIVRPPEENNHNDQYMF